MRVLAVGLAIAALAGLAWIPIDGFGAGSWIWQPGNFLVAIGAGLAAVTAWRET